MTLCPCLDDLHGALSALIPVKLLLALSCAAFQAGYAASSLRRPRPVSVSCRSRPSSDCASATKPSRARSAARRVRVVRSSPRSDASTLIGFGPTAARATRIEHCVALSPCGRSLASYILVSSRAFRRAARQWQLRQSSRFSLSVITIRVYARLWGCKVACDVPRALVMRVPACNSESPHVRRVKGRHVQCKMACPLCPNSDCRKQASAKRHARRDLLEYI